MWHEPAPLLLDETVCRVLQRISAPQMLLSINPGLHPGCVCYKGRWVIGPTWNRVYNGYGTGLQPETIGSYFEAGALRAVSLCLAPVATETVNESQQPSCMACSTL